MPSDKSVLCFFSPRAIAERRSVILKCVFAGDIDSLAVNGWGASVARNRTGVTVLRHGLAGFAIRSMSKSEGTTNCLCKFLNRASFRSIMSDLYRSAIGARISKLPHLPSLANSEDDEQEQDETEDYVGMLPGSGMGPPALQVLLLISNFTDRRLCPINKGPLVLRELEKHQMHLFLRYQRQHSLQKLHNPPCHHLSLTFEYTIPRPKPQMVLGLS